MSIFYFLIIPVFLLPIGMIAWLSWGLRCVDQTAKDRHAIIDIVYGGRPTSNTPDALAEWEDWLTKYRRRSEAYDAVTFDAHLRTLEWGRDPQDLYPPELHWK